MTAKAANKPALSATWELPSPAVRQLMRQGAEWVLSTPPELLEELDQTILASAALQSVADDPILVAAICRSNRANLRHWAASNIHNPGEPVQFNMGPEPLGIARDLVRRGIGASSLSAYRVGQNIALQKWISIAFGLTQDKDELKELLEVSTRSICAFIDTMIDGITRQMEAERDLLTKGTHAERRAMINLLIEGSTISLPRASQTLAYTLEQHHRAAVIWSELPTSEYHVLEQAVDALVQACGKVRPLTILASAASMWVWLPYAGEPDLTLLQHALQALPQVHIAIGSLAAGLDGFRRSHLDALASQRLLMRLGSPQALISHDHVWLVSLMTQDPERAQQFIQHTLGKLAHANRDTQRALQVFLHEGCCITKTAERLHTHRNTVLRRLTRAEELLPRPLASHRIQVAVALEVLAWQAN